MTIADLDLETRRVIVIASMMVNGGDLNTLMPKLDDAVKSFRDKHAEELARNLFKVLNFASLKDSPCSDCPPPDYPTDETRCIECPLRKGASL